MNRVILCLAHQVKLFASTLGCQSVVRQLILIFPTLREELKRALVYTVDVGVALAFCFLRINFYAPISFKPLSAS